MYHQKIVACPLSTLFYRYITGCFYLQRVEDEGNGRLSRKRRKKLEKTYTHTASRREETLVILSSILTTKPQTHHPSATSLSCIPLTTLSQATLENRPSAFQKCLPASCTLTRASKAATASLTSILE